MGNNWSSDGDAKRSAATGGTASQSTTPHPTDPPLHLDDIRAEPAAWDQDGFCRSVQRFLGLLPDSPVRPSRR